MVKLSNDPQLLRMLPQGQYEYVDVTFAAADTDTVITYSSLAPEDFNAIRWIDVTPGTGRVYRASNPDRTTWKQGYVILRSTVAGTTRLLLFLERE
jgi:hypothetical protein